MNKRSLCFLLFCMAVSLPAQAAYENYHPAEDKLNAFQVSGRGWGNLVGMPAEIATSLIREWRMHPRAWPVSYPPRVLTNLMTRAMSGLNDAAIFPWAVPFSDDTSSWTSGLGLPEYPWQVE